MAMSGYSCVRLLKFCGFTTRVRHQRIFSLCELNRSIAELMTALNKRPFKKLPGCRLSAFAELDHPALRPLPAMRYEIAEWKVLKVGIDYHVELIGHYYSVPYRFAREKVDSRLTATTVELFHRGTRIASHVRNDAQLFYSCAAYGLIHSLRENTLVHTELAKAQPVSIILKLFKLAVRVVQYKDRIWLSLPTACPMKGVLARVTELLYLVPRPPAPA